MRSLFKLSLASLAAVALFAGMALAQDDAAKFTTNVIFRNAFEMANKSESQSANGGAFTAKDTLTYAESGINDDWQSDLLLAWESNSVRARWQLRFREDSTTPNAARTDIYWKASSNFWLGALMRAEGIEPGISVGYSAYGGTVTGGSGMTYFGDKGSFLGGMFTNGLASQSAGPGGGVGPVGFFSDVNGLDARFLISPTMTFGVAVIDKCVPQCGYTIKDPVTGATLTGANVGSKADQTLLPYFQGAFGPLTLGVYLTSASAKIAETVTTGGGIASGGTAGKVKDKDSQSATANLADVNGKVAVGAALIGFEYWNVSQSCNSSVLHGGKQSCTAATEGGLAVGVKLPAGPGTLTAHVESISDNATPLKDNTATQSISDVMVEYSIPVSPNLKLVPLYTTRTFDYQDKQKNALKTTDVRTTGFAALGMRGDF